MKLRNVCTAVSLILLALSCAQATVIVDPSLVGWWKGDGNALDSSGKSGRDGAYTGAYGAGYNGQAFKFSGLASGYVTIENQSDFPSAGGDFTAAFWFKGAPTGDVFMGQDLGDGWVPKWFIAYGYGQANSFQLHLNGFGNTFINSDPVTLDDRWYHLALTKTGTVYSFYLDGSAIGSISNSTMWPSPNAPLTLGGAEYLPYSGMMDDVTLYSRALSGAEVGILADMGSVPEPAAFFLLGAGLMSVAFLKRRKQP